MAFSGSEADFLATTSGTTLVAFSGKFCKLSSVYQPTICISQPAIKALSHGVFINGQFQTNPNMQLLCLTHVRIVTNWTPPPWPGTTSRQVLFHITSHCMLRVWLESVIYNTGGGLSYSASNCVFIYFCLSSVIILYYARWQHKNKKNTAVKRKIYRRCHKVEASCNDAVHLYVCSFVCRLFLPNALCVRVLPHSDTHQWRPYVSRSVKFTVVMGAYSWYPYVCHACYELATFWELLRIRTGAKQNLWRLMEQDICTRWMPFRSPKQQSVKEV